MYLQKVEIHGFKSFAHKTVLEFPPPARGTRGIASIVGPNGSGKSNVADAVRWVLGEQSMKLLRGKKSEDVIFAGSDKKTRLGLAEVSIHLNNEDRTAPVDYSEVVITRRVLRTGEGEYFLNRTPVRLHDILLLLAKANFGQRTYAIIGQGMVDEILLATPQGRKEFFDEAAGIRAFQIKRDQAVAKLDQTKENLRQADLLVQEIAPRLRSLTRQVKRLEQREAVVAELREAQLVYYRHLWHDVRGKLEEVRKRHASAESARIAAVDRVESLKTKLEQFSQAASRQQVFARLQATYRKLTDEKNALLRERAAIQGKLDAGRSAAGEANVVWLERKVEELEGEIERLADDRREHENRVKALAARRADEERKLAAIQTSIGKIQTDLHEAQESMSRHAMTLPEVHDALSRIFADQSSFVERLKAVATLEELNALKADADRIAASFARFLDEVKRQLPSSVPADLKKLQSELQSSLNDKDRIVQALADLKSEAGIFAERAKVAADQLEAAQDELTSAKRELEASAAKGGDHEAILKAQIADVDRKLSDHEKAIKAAESELTQFNEAEQQKQQELLKVQHDLSQQQGVLQQAAKLGSDIAVEAARLETRMEDLERELREEVPDLIERIRGEPRSINSVELRGEGPAGSVDADALHRQIQQLKGKVELIGGIDPQVAQEYRETKERHDFLTTQSEDLQKAIEDLESGIESLDGTIKERFDQAFLKINEEFGKYFKMLFEGGRASLELIREELLPEPLEGEEGVEPSPDELEPIKPKRGPKVITGVDIHATPPGKRLKSINMLSGGERALTSIALICAIIASNPAPFVVLDEVDAALDEANSLRLSQIVEQLAKKTQFIIITHNRATMERAQVLYGVTMGEDGVSRLLSVKMEEAERVISAHGNR